MIVLFPPLLATYVVPNSEPAVVVELNYPDNSPAQDWKVVAKSIGQRWEMPNTGQKGKTKFVVPAGVRLQIKTGKCWRRNSNINSDTRLIYTVKERYRKVGCG